MCHLLLLYICVAGIASASSSPEADISSGYSPGTEVTPASVELPYSSTPILNELNPFSPTITTYSTVPQDTAVLKHTTPPHVGCKCNKKNTTTEIKFGARSLTQTDGANSAVSQTEAVPTIVSSTPAPIDGSPVIYIAAPRRSHAQETVPGYDGYDTSANKVFASPTAATYSALPGGINNFADQKLSAVAANNNANFYPGTPGIQYFANPVAYATSPNSANLYQAQGFPSPINYPKSNIGLDFYNHNSPYVVNPYDPRLNYSPINPAAYAVNPGFPNPAAGPNAAVPSDPNAGYIIYNTAPLTHANNQFHANSPSAYPFAAVASSTPRPIIYGGQEPQNIAPQSAGPYDSYINNAAAHSTAAGSPRTIVIYTGASPVPSFPQQYPYPAVNNNHAPTIQNYAVPENSAFSHSSPSGHSAFTRPVSFATVPRPLSAKAISVPAAQNDGTVVPSYSTNPAPPKSGTVYSSAPDVSRVQFNGGGVSYSW